MKLSAKTILTVGLLIVSVLSTLILSVITRQQQRTPKFNTDTSRPFPNLTPKAQRPVEDSAFTKSGYIVPLESNASGSAYSSRAQVRGTVKRWSSEILTVTVSAQETKDIKFSPFVRLYCTPKYFTDNRGNQVLASTVWVSVPSPETEGTLTPTTDIAKQFSVGSDVLVYVNVDSQDAMTANLVVGYGCQVKK